MSAIRRWTVSSDPIGCGHRYWFYVFVYETNAELQRAAHAYRPHSEIDWEGCAGCFQPSLSIGVPDRYMKDPDSFKISDVPVKARFRSKNNAFIGVMRLSMEQMTVDTIIHESTHAATNYVASLNLVDRYTLCGGEIAKQEQLCYATGEFSTALLKMAGLIDG